MINGIILTMRRSRPGYFLDIETDLKQKEENFPFVENIYLYQPDRERVLSSGGLYEADYFFQSICMMERDFPEEQEAICARRRWENGSRRKWF